MNRVEYRGYTLTQTVGRIRGARVSGGQADVTAATRCLPLLVLPLTAGAVTTHVLSGVTVLARHSAVAYKFFLKRNVFSNRRQLLVTSYC